MCIFKILFYISILCSFFACNNETITISKEPKHDFILQATKKIKKRNFENSNAFSVGIINQGEKVYFFKFVASKKELRNQKKEIKKILQTLKLKKGNLNWIINKNWEKLKIDNSIIQEKYSFKNSQIILTISALPYSSILSNVNRWRRQLSLEKTNLENLRKQLKLIQLGNITIHYIDIGL